MCVFEWDFLNYDRSSGAKVSYYVRKISMIDVSHGLMGQSYEALS